MAKDLFGIVGTVIAGTYEVEAVVAEGGFAVVYRAHHQGFGAKVALKCLKLSRKVGPERQAEFLAQFKAEAALLFQLSSSIPTVVRPLHIDALTTKDGTFVPYMVLEWLEGETLDAIVHHRAADQLPPAPLKKLVRLLGPVAQALARAHDFTSTDGAAVSIVHQDIKPENIFVASVAGEQVVKILDFGVAKAQSVASQVAGAGAGAEKSGVHSFTPAYAAPEQWAPDKYGETGPWTDVWGLALTLVEAMAGRLVIDGDVHTMMNITLDPVARPTPMNNDVDVTPEVEAVFERALALRPKDRPANVGQFWDELLVALGMKEGHRDARREAGAQLREERVEVPKPKPKPAAGKALARMKLKPAPKAPLALPKHRLTIDDPFELDEPASPFGGVEAVPPAPGRPPRPAPKQSLELKLPSEPPGPVAAVPKPGLGASLEDPFASLVAAAPNLEAAIPSVPPPVGPSSLEAAFPSMPPEPVAAPVPKPTPNERRPAPHAASAGSFDFELEVPAAPKAPAHRPDPVLNRDALDVDAAVPSERPAAAELEASLRPRPRAVPGIGGELDMGAESPALRVDLRSELPPGPGAAAPRPAPTRTAPARPAPVRAAPDPFSDAPTEKRKGVNLLAVGSALIVGAIAIALADKALRTEDGAPVLAVGPISAVVVAGLCFAVGLGLVIYQFLPHDDR